MNRSWGSAAITIRLGGLAGAVLVVVALGCQGRLVRATRRLPSGSAEVPLLHSSAGRPTVLARFVAEGGRVLTVPMLIDTGASRTAVSLPLARALGLEFYEDHNAVGQAMVGRRHRVFRATVPQVHLHQLQLDDVHVMVLRKVRKMRAILGTDLLGECPLTIDLERGVAVFCSAPLTGPNVRTIKVSVGGHPPKMGARVGLNGKTVWMLLDTGATRTGVDQRTGRRLGLEVAWHRRPVNVLTAFGVYQEHGFFKVSSTRFAARPQGPLRVSPLPKFRMKAAFLKPLFGLLGMDLLRRFVFRIDMEEETLQLRPIRDPNPTIPSPPN